MSEWPTNDQSIDKSAKNNIEKEIKNNKFEVFFEEPYAELRKAVVEYVRPDSSVLDIGAYEGRLEDYLEEKGGHYFVKCVDMDADALKVLSAKDYQNVETETFVADANTFIENYAGTNNIDSILLSATLHEINDPAKQKEYLEDLFSKAGNILKQGGNIIIGDFYYPDSVSDEEFESFREYQLKAINHADARNKFVKPDLIIEVAQKHGFSVESLKEIRAVKEIDRKYYVLVLMLSKK